MKTKREEPRLETGVQTFSPQWQTPFFWSSGTLLLLTGCAKLWSAMGTERILAIEDELLLISNRELMIAVGLLELVVACIVLRGREPVFSAALLFWLSGNFALYRLGMMFTVSTICPCLGTLYAKLGLTPGVFDVLLKGIVVYFCVGSLAVLWPHRDRVLHAVKGLNWAKARTA